MVQVEGHGQYALALTELDGVWTSSDSMATWSPANGLPSGTSIQQVQLIDSIAYASTYSGFYRSIDHGVNWSFRSAEYHDPFIYSEGRLIGGDFMSGIRVSEDDGLTWADSNSGLPQEVLPGGGQTHFIGPNNIQKRGSTLFISTDRGLYRSDDNGSTWALVGFSNMVLRYVVASGDTLVVSDGSNVGGLSISTDDGASWATAFVGGNNEITDCLLLLDGRIYAGTDNGIYSSSDLGASWQHDTGLVYNSFASVAADASTIVLGALGSDQSGLMYSNDQGASWTQSSGTSPKYGVDDLVKHGENWFATVQLNGMNTGSSSYGVYRSTDGAQSWDQVYFYPWEGLASAGPYLFAGATGGVMRSGDEGQSWIAVNNGFQHANEMINCFASVGDTLYAGSMNFGVYRSTDLGQNWIPAISGIGDRWVRCLAVSNGKVFASTDDGIYRSDDQGANWFEVNAGLPSVTFIPSIIAHDGLLMAAVFGQGVYVSGDQGGYWYPASEGLFDPDVSALAVQGDTVYATTWGSGVFKSSVQFLAGLVGIDEQAPNAGERVRVYPNPCYGAVQLSFTMDSPAMVRIELLDALGRKVTDAWHGVLAPGDHVQSVQVPIAGPVLIRLSVGGKVVTRRVVSVPR